MKAIDFHIHTVPEEEKDHLFTFSQEWLNEYAKRARLDAIAICNHNVFNTTQFREISQSTEIAVFPGMELSLLTGHVLIVYDKSPAAIAELSHASEKIHQIQLGSSTGLNLDQFFQFFPSWKQSVLVFEITKSNSMSIPTELRAATCLGGVSSPNRFQRELSIGNEIPALFSDAHASYDESDQTRSDIAHLAVKHTFIECDTVDFQDIRQALQSKTTVGVNREQVNDVYDIVVDDHPLTVSTGLNLVVGRRGSGKTFLIDSIAHDSNDNVYKLEQFDTASNREQFLHRQQQQKGEQAYKNFTKKYQKAWNQINDTLMVQVDDKSYDISLYLEKLSQYANSYNSRGQAAQIKLFGDRPYDILQQRNLTTELTNLREIINSKEIWNHVNHAYRSYFIKAYQELQIFLRKDKIQSEQRSRINALIVTVQSEVRRQSGIMEPPTINLTDVFKRRLVQRKTDNFLEKLLFSTTDGLILSQQQFGEYRVVVRLVPFDDATEYRKAMHTGEGVKTKLLVPYKEHHFSEYLNHLMQYAFYKPNHLTDYIATINTSLETAKGNPASGGQQVAFALLMGLEEAKNSDIALIDEPEASLDNHFIKTTLIPKLRELATHTSTFVITHNSTLGTLLRPNYLIVAKTSDEKKFDYLSGDFKSAKIRNVDGSQFESIDDFVDAMESGLDTYREKGEIYGSLNHR